MTIGGFNIGGDLDLCAQETDKAKFLANVKKLAMQRSVAERAVMLWCYQRCDSPEAIERIRNWIAEEDKTGKWLMSLPEFEVVES